MSDESVRHLLLIGARGAGKSTIGRQLANRLNRPFVDLDDLALALCDGDSVRDVWRTKGEQTWRRAELAGLEQTLGTPESTVLALGGGAVMTIEVAEAIRTLQREGRVVVVYLCARPETLRGRLAAEPGDRPGLTGDDPIAEVQAVLAAREPTYHALADHVINIDDRSVDETVSAVAAVFDAM